MIIKGLFRRYERWNPVHPTSGAFWGMGIGIGCGVGWGPGFGPEVVGYVGAGCGVGFSVGITFAGLGIGLPANYVYAFPYNAAMATKNGMIDIAQSTAPRIAAWDGWDDIKLQISGLHPNSLPRIRVSNPFVNIFSGVKPLVTQLDRIKNRFIRSDKGSKE